MDEIRKLLEEAEETEYTTPHHSMLQKPLMTTGKRTSLDIRYSNPWATIHGLTIPLLYPRGRFPVPRSPSGALGNGTGNLLDDGYVVMTHMHIILKMANAMPVGSSAMKTTLLMIALAVEQNPGPFKWRPTRHRVTGHEERNDEVDGSY
jgi:hypothetical protein